MGIKIHSYPRPPPWLKNSFKVEVGLSTQEKFEIAQIGLKKDPVSQKPAKKLDSQNLIT